MCLYKNLILVMFGRQVKWTLYDEIQIMLYGL